MNNLLIVALLFLAGCLDTNKVKKSSPTPIEDGRELDTTTPTSPVEPAPTEPLPELKSCELYCYDSLSFRPLITGYDYLSFENFGYRGIGRCRGHALVTQKFNMLANFDDSSAACDLSEDSCWQDVLSQIKLILSYQVQTIKGYKDLYDFSQQKRVKTYLRSIVAGTSHRYQAIDSKLQVRHYANQKLNTFYDLVRRVNLNHQPYVGVVGNLTGAHALLIYDVKSIQGKKILCARDPNIVLDYPEECETYIFIRDQKIHYRRYDRKIDELGVFKITSDEDQRVKLYENALRAWCIESSKADGLCK